MSVKYEDVLRELELLPVWQLKQATSASAVQEQQASPVQPSAPLAEASKPKANFAEMSLQEIQQQIVAAGDSNAAWLFVGEQAGEIEKQLSQPFAGEAGGLLDKMLAAINLKRDQNVYLMHWDNSSADSLAVLSRIVKLIKPKLIVALGEKASQSLVKDNSPLDSLRGNLHHYEAVPVVASYAPRHLLKHEADKRKAWADLCLARDTMAKL